MGVAGFEWKIGDARFYGEAFYGEAYKCYLQFYSKCDTLFIKYSDLRGSRYLSKRNGTEIIECSGDAGSGEKRC